MVTAEDAARRAAIADYEVIGEPPEPDLHGLVQLAATICGVSTAVINIIDDRAQHQIAAVGLEPAVCAREDSMCAAVLQDAAHIVVADARSDARFAANPFVTGEIARVRFYASSPLITPAGIPIGTLCVFDEEVGELTAERSRSLDHLARQVVDVLELRRITRRLAQSNEQLALFAGQVSHDLRNPLTALLGFVELATDSAGMSDRPEALQLLQRAEAAGARMAGMLTDLLRYARVDGAGPDQTELDFEHVVRSVTVDLHASLAPCDATVTVDAPVRFAGDETLLRTLLQNLVANAAKFSAAAGVRPCIAIRARALATGWQVTVDDNGPGVPEEDRERVFGLMQRGRTATAPGLGIGLSTCRRIVQAHGGRIGIADSPAGGARVWLTLPHSATGPRLIPLAEVGEPAPTGAR